jgi:hypothetical protein
VDGVVAGAAVDVLASAVPAAAAVRPVRKQQPVLRNLGQGYQRFERIWGDLETER